MHDIDLTDSQFQILLGMTSEPDVRHAEANVSLVTALHRAHCTSHRWRTKMTDQEVETATGLLMDHQKAVRTHVAKKAVTYLVRSNNVAHAYYKARNGDDVPRETSAEESP